MRIILHGFSASSVVSIYKKCIKTIFETPSILFLFFTLGLFDLSALIALLCSSSWPISGILSPIIKAFWGEQYLHYPNNFILLPKLFQHVHFLTLTVWGVFVSGMVIKKVEAAASHEPLLLTKAFSLVTKKYFSILFIWFFTYGTFNFFIRKLIGFFPDSLAVQFAAALFFGILLQSVYAYFLPVILIEKASFFRNFWLALKTGIRYIPATSAILFIPFLLVLLLSFTKAFAVMIVRFNPELVGGILFAGIGVTLAADAVVTVATTLLYLEVRNSK